MYVLNIDDNLSVFLATAATGGLKTQGSLEGVVDPPLETSEGTDHDDPGHETRPEALESNFSIDPAHLFSEGSGFAALRVEFGDHGVCGVGDNCAEDTGQVAGGEGDAQLSALVVVLLAFGEDVIVEELYEPFKSHELHDSVRHLSAPKRSESFVQSADA